MRHESLETWCHEAVAQELAGVAGEHNATYLWRDVALSLAPSARPGRSRHVTARVVSNDSRAAPLNDLEDGMKINSEKPERHYTYGPDRDKARAKPLLKCVPSNLALPKSPPVP